MHYLTSNFNLISSNNNWAGLKKIPVCVDSDYDNFYLNVSSNQNRKKYVSFHVLIYFNKKNYKKTFREIKALSFFFKKNPLKPFFFYFFKDKSFDKSNILKKFESKYLRAFPNFFMYNYEFSKEKLFYSKRNYKFLKFPFDLSSISFFTKTIKSKILLLNNRPYKLIILDCDNTLWDGILDENYDKQISYKNSNRINFFYKLQKKIKQLKDRGFLLSLCSKNDESRVWNFFKKRKMILQKKDFVFSKINWREKPDNIISIVKNLGLRYEDCIFIDDNIIEIKKVQNKIKNINTLHLKDISKFENIFSKDNRFQKLIVSKDDIKKTKLYNLRSKFNTYVHKNKISPNLIENLNQKIKIFKCKNSNIKRAEELFNKTNQFNFTLNRYKNNEITSIVKKKDYDLRLFSLKDKFGNHGIIGAYILKRELESIKIIDFVLSCRVLSRYVEEYILCQIFKEYKDKKVFIFYKKTPVNSNLIPELLKKKFFKLKSRKMNFCSYQISFNKKQFAMIKTLFI